MAETRVFKLAKDLKIEVRELIQRLREDFGLEVGNPYSTIDEATSERVRQLLSQMTPQVEEKRIGDNVKRRRRVAPAMPQPVSPPREEPEAAAPAAPSAVVPETPPPMAEVSRVPRPRRESRARVVTLPLKDLSAPVPSPAVEEPAPSPAPEAAAPVEPVAEVALAEPPTPPAEPAPVLESPAPSPPEVETPAAPTPVATAEPAPAVPKRPKPKARKKETPARIISLPPELPKREEPPVRPVVPPAPEPPEMAPRAVADLRPAVVPEKRPAEVLKPKKATKGKRPEVVEIPKAGKAAKKREVRERETLYGEGEIRLPGKKKGLKKAVKKVTRAELTVPKAIKRRIKVGESITVGDLAKRMGIKSSEVIKQLLKLGLMVTINHPIDFDVASLVASDFGFEVERATPQEEDLLAQATALAEGTALVPRPPVVTIMGHVDHGKTSLLDAIRESRVIETEAGGITQHIGAYHVKLPDDRGEVVFLDTPGHEAFTAMRARGAQVTDLVVLVVAADDGVMEQTQEAISHARAANVPVVVAVNKIDKPGANPERVKRELANLGIVPEEWGGDVLFAEVSAKKRIGIEDLLEKILLQAEILDLKAPVDCPAQGRIVESRLDKGRGPVGTVLVLKGTLKQGDYFVCGTQYGRVRAMFDDRGNRVEEATPGLPVEVQGFSGVPEAGDEFQVLEDERKAKQIAMMRQQKQREAALAKLSRVSLEKLYQQIKEGTVKELKIVLKADVMGSIEALSKALSELGNEEIKVNLIHTGIGEVSESDIMLASASDAIVVGFNVKANPKAQALAEQEHVDVRFYDIIYNLLHDVEAALEGMLEPVVEERVIGTAEVRATFTISKVGTVAGCLVTDGKVERNALARVKRGGEVLAEGLKVSSLKRFKEDVREVQAGYECGIGLDRFSDFQPGDLIEVYVQEKVKAGLSGVSRGEARE